MKEISEEQVEFVKCSGRSGFSIRRALIEVEKSVVEWWKMYYHSGNGPGVSGSCDFVAHAPTRELALEQARKIKNGPYTHLFLKLES
jgi:hypothetical protein